MPATETSVQPPLARIGFSGYPVFGRSSYPGSDEWHRELSGCAADRKYREMMDQCGIVATTSRLITTLCQQVEWRVTNAVSEDPQAVLAGDLVRAEWSAMKPGWRQIIAEMVSALFIGWSWHEVVYRRVGVNWGWEGWYFCRQDSRLRWHWSDDGRTLIALEQLTRSGQSALIPVSKSIRFIPDPTTGGPEGRGILRAVYPDYRDQQAVNTSTLIAMQKDATGAMVVRVPADTFTQAAAGNTEASATLDQVKRDVASFQRGEREGIVLPSSMDSANQPTGWDATLMQGGGERQINHVELLNYYDRRIAVTLMTQFLLLGQGKAGSFALSSDQTELLGVVLGGYCDAICDIITEQAIKPLCALNGYDASVAPMLARGPIDPPDLDSLATLLREAIAGGIIKPDAALEAHVRNAAGLPKAPDAATLSAAGSVGGGDSIAEPAQVAPSDAAPVASQALNGIQIQSLGEILAGVTNGTTTSILARKLIGVAFPAFTQSQIDDLVSAAEQKPDSVRVDSANRLGVDAVAGGV